LKDYSPQEVFEEFQELAEDETVQYLVALESVHSMPKQGVASSFKFGMNFGRTMGHLDASGLRYELVSPQMWINRIGISKRKKTETKAQWKKRLRELAQQLFPNLEVEADTADALLIAEFLRRREIGQIT
jgi:crossover junction endodeoxyribonuclease RuvC